MAEHILLTKPMPLSDKDAFQAECNNMIDWIGTIDMPEERVGLREAAGNLGGILVGLMRENKAWFYTEESSNVSDLTCHLRQTNVAPARADILSAIHECACMARDKGSDLEIEFK